MATAEEAFNECKGDADGLTRSQAYDALCMMGQNPTTLDMAAFWKEKKKSDEDTITLEELEELNSKLGDPVEVMREAFKVFDKNGDHRISLEELKAILKSSDIFGSGFGDDTEMIEQIFNEGDKNADGTLDTNELIEMIQSGALNFSAE